METPFWDNASALVVAERWSKRLKELPAYYSRPLLVEEEKEQREKTAGFASIALPWDQVQAEFLDPFFGIREAVSYDPIVLRKACDKVRSLLPGRRAPLPLDIAQQRAPRNTSSGLPEWSTDPEVLPEYLKRSRVIVESYDPSLFYPFVAGRRTTNAAASEVSKQRLLWIVDKAEVPIGKSVGDVVLSELRSYDHFAAWLGPQYVDVAVSKMLGRGIPIHSIDFSKYDASIENFLIQAAFELLMDWVKAPYLETVGELFMHGDLVFPWAIANNKKRGVPSGSSLTNMIDTLVQTIIWHYVSIELGVELVDYMVQGDDGLVQFTPSVEPSEIEPLLSTLGLTFNADKTMYSSEACKYLQNLHLKDHQVDGVNVGIRSSFRMLHRIKRPERLSATLTPALMSVSAALKADKVSGSPYFEEWVQFYWSGDKLIREKPLVTLLREAGGGSFVKSALKIDSFSYTERDPELIDALPISAVVEKIRRRAS